MRCPISRCLSLALDGDTVYAGTGMGVAEIRDGKFTRVLAPGYFAQTLLAADGKLWIGTLDEGMVEVPLDAHPGRGSRLGARECCPDCSIRKILRIDGDVYALAEDSLWRGVAAK